MPWFKSDSMDAFQIADDLNRKLKRSLPHEADQLVQHPIEPEGGSFGRPSSGDS